MIFNFLALVNIPSRFAYIQFLWFDMLTETYRGENMETK